MRVDSLMKGLDAMRTIRHRPSVHEFSHGATKVIELVEDMRPFVHIFFADIFPPIAAMAIVAGIFKIASANSRPVIRPLAIVSDSGNVLCGPVITPFRHHGLHA
jgi:hypothetical protein